MGRAATVCAEPRCPHPATYRGRCREHKRMWRPDTKQTRRLRARVRARARGRCEKCKRATDAFVIDHRVPLALGGADDESNLQALCLPCNRIKTRADLAAIRAAR